MQEGLYRNYEEVPDNLPEKASIMALLRAAHTAISNDPTYRPILPNRLITKDRYSGDRYAAVDEILQQDSSLFEKTIPPDQQKHSGASREKKQHKSSAIVTAEDDAWASGDVTHAFGESAP